MHEYPPYPAVNEVVQALLTNVQQVLGSNLVGLYLDGSLTAGDFDEDSDIDFAVVTQAEVTMLCFLQLCAMHEALSTRNSPYAFELQGSYISAAALRRYDPTQCIHPNLERGREERLKMVPHGAA